MSLHVSARRIPACLLIAVLLVAAAGIGEAAEGARSEEPRASQMIGGAVRLSTGPKREISPAVAFNAEDSEYLVVWEDWRDSLGGSGRGKDLYGRRVDATGARHGIFRISSATDTYDDDNPSVAWNAIDDEFLVVWARSSNIWDPGRTDEIYGRRMKGDGTFLGPSFRISGPVEFGGVSHPAVAWNTVDHQFLVVWNDGRNDDSLIYGRRINADGAFLGAEFRIGGPRATETFRPAVAFDATRTEYLVVWEDDRNYDDRRGDIYACRIDADGTPLGNDLRVSGPNAVENDWDPYVAWNAALDQYLVVWDDGRNWEDRGSDIYGVLLKGADGSRLGGDVLLVHPVYNVLSDYVGGLAWNPISGKYLMTYQDWSLDLIYGWDIYGQRITAEGKRLGNKFRIIPPKGSEEVDLTDDTEGVLAWNNVDNEYLVVWVDYRLEGTSAFNLDIWARRVAG